MEFRPFWDLLSELGIALPDPSKLEGKGELQKPAEGGKARRSRRISIQPAFANSPLDLLDLLSELSELTALELPDNDLTEAEDCWVAPNQTVQVAGYDIPGMVYVGEGLAAINNYRAAETSLINPRLKVKRDDPDYEGKRMPYSASYGQMPPACRAAYLDWLSTGRQDSNVYIGYIWLFFYGLERRVFHNLLTADFSTCVSKQQELKQIVAEVERLNQLYDTSGGGINSKAQVFLEVCYAVQSALSADSDSSLEETIDPLTARSLLLQVGLGQKVAKGLPIPADWALGWYSRLSDRRLPMAALRCVEEFRALFRLHYAQKYGEGLRLKAGKARLTATYYPTSQSFWGRSLSVPIGNLPDVTRFSAKLKQIGSLVETCRLELEPLSRYVGRNPEGRKTQMAIALLPPDLLATHGGSVVQELQQWLSQLFTDPATEAVDVSGADLFRYWSGTNPDKLTKSEATGLSQLLERLGYGMESDPRFGGAVPMRKSHTVLFRLASPHMLQLSSVYLDAALLLHLAIAVASGDERPSPSEQVYLRHYLVTLTALSDEERSRLAARMQWLLVENPTLRNLRAQIERVQPSQRQAIARFLVGAAIADGQASPKEIDRLTKVYQLLELDPKSVYGDVHDRSTAAADSRPVSEPVSELVTVRLASPARGHKIPAKSKAKSSEDLALNMSLVQSKISESAEISTLLAEIFSEAEVPLTEVSLAEVPLAESLSPPSPKAEKEGQLPQLGGLDAAHSQLLQRLAQQPIWQRSDLEAIATQLDLMLDGALEVLNETAFDRYDEALIEGEDPIEINLAILQEWLAA